MQQMAPNPTKKHIQKSILALPGVTRFLHVFSVRVGELPLGENEFQEIHSPLSSRYRYFLWFFYQC